MKVRCKHPRCSSQVPSDGGKVRMTSFEFDPGEAALKDAACPKCKTKGKLVDAAEIDCNGDKVEPKDPRSNSEKVYCMYYAIANALNPTVGNAKDQQEAMAKIVDETKKLRQDWPLAYDEDEWALVMAEYYGFKTLKTGLMRSEVESTCKAVYDKTEAANSFYIIGFPKADAKKDAHALCLKFHKGVGKPPKAEATYYDNDKPMETKAIHSDYKDWKFDVYEQKRRANDVGKLSHEQKKAMLSTDTLARINATGGC